MGITDGAAVTFLVAFLTLLGTVAGIGAALWHQNREQKRTIGRPNGGGSLAGDVAELRGRFEERSAVVDGRLDRLDAGQQRILTLLED